MLFRVDGKPVRNTLTENGERFLYGYLAGEYQTWAGKIVLGVGETPSTRQDTRLEFETARADVDLVVSDVSRSAIVVRGLVDSGVQGTFTELGLYATREPTAERILLSFAPDIEDVEGGVQVYENFRIGDAGLLVSTVETDVVTYPNYKVNLNDMLPHDTFSLAYNRLSGTGAMQMRFVKDSTNYFYYNFATAAGYNVASWQRDSSSREGELTWAEINRLELHVNGAMEVVPDGLRINRESRLVTQGLVARAILPVPKVKSRSQQMDVEYILRITFG